MFASFCFSDENLAYITAFMLLLAILNRLSFGLDLALQFFLGGDIEHILRGKDLAVVLGKRVFDDGVVLSEQRMMPTGGLSPPSLFSRVCS